MNVKRIFGALLTILGIIGLVFAAIVFANLPGGAHNFKPIIIFGILGIVFFTSGIGLIRATRDES